MTKMQTLREFKDVTLTVSHNPDTGKTRFRVWALDLITPDFPKAVRSFKTFAEAKALYEELTR